MAERPSNRPSPPADPAGAVPGATAGCSDPVAPEARAEVVWVSCPDCWGQRRIVEYRPARNGERLVPVLSACSRCLGIGEVARWRR